MNTEKVFARPEQTEDALCDPVSPLPLLYIYFSDRFLCSDFCLGQY